MKKKGLLAAVLLCISMCFTGCLFENKADTEEEDTGIIEGDIVFNENLAVFKRGELDKPIEVEGMLSLTMFEDDKNGFYDQFYPYNAFDAYSGYDLADEGEPLLCMYGVIENLTSRELDISDVVDITVQINGEYEYGGVLWLENEDETELAEDNILQAEAEEFCALICPIKGEEVGDVYSITLNFYIIRDVEGYQGKEHIAIDLTVTD